VGKNSLHSSKEGEGLEMKHNNNMNSRVFSPADNLLRAPLQEPPSPYETFDFVPNSLSNFYPKDLQK
jgi:hypothetical protein